MIERMIDQICDRHQDEIVDRFVSAITEVDKLLQNYDKEIAKEEKDAGRDGEDFKGI